MVVTIRPVERGFFCDDETIKYPRRLDTVTLTMLVVFTTIITPTIFVVVECITYLISRRHQSSDTSQQSSWLRSAACSAVILYGFFWVGLMTTLIVTEVGKLTIGRLRPHFFDVCRPVFNTTACTGYVLEYRCSDIYPPRLVAEARKSFPSGHSSLSVYMAVFLAYYIQRRLRTPFSQLLRLVVQLSLCSLAVFTCLSRVTDNMHHWSDVTVGALVGVLTAVWTIMFLRKAVTWHTEDSLKVSDAEAADVATTKLNIQNSDGDRATARI
jgi:phosphatidate phosphatase